MNRCLAAEASPLVDLADRRTPQLDVVLFWRRSTGQLWVDVTHRRTGVTIHVAATPANALDVFRHPFVYAAEAA
jgi:hypothetical protein